MFFFLSSDAFPYFFRRRPRHMNDGQLPKEGVGFSPHKTKIKITINSQRQKINTEFTSPPLGQLDLKQQTTVGLHDKEALKMRLRRGF